MGRRGPDPASPFLTLRGEFVPSEKRSQTGRFDTISSPFDGAHVSEVALATTEEVDVAIAAAAQARATWGGSARHVRAAIAERVAQRLGERKEELARLITLE